jgi:arylsulfatase A-like enzyme
LILFFCSRRAGLAEPASFVVDLFFSQLNFFFIFSLFFLKTVILLNCNAVKPYILFPKTRRDCVMKENRPNILYLHCHDAGRYIQPYGHSIQTPNLQRLAEQGVLFRQNFCAGPTCSPSRAALLTGQNCHSSGMLGLAHRGFRLNDYRQHLIHTLHDAGYSSFLAGIQHIACPPAADTSEIGYTEVLTTDGGFAGPTTAAVDFLHDPPDEPFFLSVGYLAPHRDFPTLYPADDSRYIQPPAPIPDTPETRQDMARYNASVRSTDHCMGSVLKALEKNGLADNTLVICTTDHGIAFPRMKCNLNQYGLGTFLIMRGPGGFAGGKVIDALTSHIDVFPTVCELLDIGKPEWLEGESLLPLVRGEDDEIREFAEVSYHGAYEPQRAVRSHRWSYVRRYDDRESVVLPNCDDSLSKTFWVDNGWKEQPRYQEMLFDLVFDPAESCNIIGKPGAEQVLKDMRDLLDRWMRETNDPILEGDIPLPECGITTDPDMYSPDGKG